MINFGCFVGLISRLCDWCELQLKSGLIIFSLLDQPEQTFTVFFICVILILLFVLLLARTFRYFLVKWTSNSSAWHVVFFFSISNKFTQKFDEMKTPSPDCCRGCLWSCRGSLGEYQQQITIMWCVTFSLWECELWNWIVGSSKHTWNPVLFQSRRLRSGNCWHAHIECESSKISVFWEIIMSIFTSAYAWWRGWPCDGGGQQWLATNSYSAQSKWIFPSATMLLLPGQIALLLNQHPIRHRFDIVNLEGTMCQTRLRHLVGLNLENGRQEMRYLAYGQSDRDTEPLC